MAAGLASLLSSRELTRPSTAQAAIEGATSFERHLFTDGDFYYTFIPDVNSAHSVCVVYRQSISCWKK